MSLILNNISKSFEEKKVIDNLSIEFSNIGIYALVGKSGIGKTTLLRIIAGLEKDYCGEALGGGIGRVSFAFQEHRLFPHLTAIENVIFAISDGKDKAVFEKAQNMLLRLGLSKSDHLLMPSELSGGMKQRISLARAFLKKSDILLLDEPTKELDLENARLVRKIIEEEAKSRLVILATHSQSDLCLSGIQVVNL